MKRNNIHDIVLPLPGIVVGIMIGAACQLPSMLFLWSAFHTDMYGVIFNILFVVPLCLIGGLILQFRLSDSFRRKRLDRVATGIWLVYPLAACIVLAYFTLTKVLA